MSRTVFIQRCFHGWHRPHADDLRALILRCVSFVFMGFPGGCEWGRGNQRVFAFGRHDSRHFPGGKAVVKGRHGFDSLHPLQRRAK
jgi:hypothetical protein